MAFERKLESKLVVLGSSGVGKTSLVLQFVENRFSPEPLSTQGAMFVTKKLVLGDNNLVKLQLWDTAGQERFRSLNPLYYREANAAILVYDVGSQASFDALPDWHAQLMQHVDTDIVIALCGNKVDLPRAVDRGEAEKYAKQLGALYFETSAKTNVHVEDLFKEIGTRLLHLDVPKARREDLVLRGDGKQASGGGCC